jgi:hypothetical protein
MRRLGVDSEKGGSDQGIQHKRRITSPEVLLKRFFSLRLRDEKVC